MQTDTNKVLILTYYFPPSGGSGVQRTLKFVKYLRDFGWEPVVLTAGNADYPIYDESLQAEIPEGVKIYRAPIFEPYRIYRKLTGKKGQESTDVAVLSLETNQKQKFSERLSEWIRSCFFIPDARMFWLYPAFWLGRKIIEKENIKVILSSAPPYTSHLIARKLSVYSKLPWVADFRDSWIGWLSAPQWRPWWARAVERRMERVVLRDADRILAVSKGVREDLLSRHPELRDDRWIILTNGYDEQDLEGVIPEQKIKGKLTITYSGSMYGNRHPKYFLRALEIMRRENPDVYDKLRIRLVGRVAEAILREIRASPAGGIFEHIPYVTHSKSLSYLLGSDAALLIVDDAPQSRGIMTGKIFEYIGAGLPIFALAPDDGDAAGLIQSNGLGVCAPPGDPDAIKDALQKFVDMLKNKRYIISNDTRQKYERRFLTLQLKKILDGLIHRSFNGVGKV